MSKLIRLVDFLLNCDECGWQDNTLEHSDTGKEPQNERDAIKLFREFGWIIGKRNICMDCAAKGVKP